MVNLLTATRFFPENYTESLTDVLQCMSLSNNIENVTLNGTSAFRSLLYYADYDAVEIYEKGNAKQLQAAVKRLQKLPLCYVDEFKGGVIKEWNVLNEEDTVKQYSRFRCHQKLRRLKVKNIISEKEYFRALSLLVKNPNVEQFHNMKKEWRFGVLRWKARDILKGYLILRDGSKYCLQKAFKDNSLKKLDVVAWIDTKFMECTMIYFKHEMYIENYEDKLVLDIRYYQTVGNYFKSLKRLFSLYRDSKSNEHDKLEDIVSILNSDIGILYVVVNDIAALIYVLQEVPSLPKKHVKLAFNNVRENLGKVYSLLPFLKKEETILKDILKMEKNIHKISIPKLEALQNDLTLMLNNATRRKMKDCDLLH